MFLASSGAAYLADAGGGAQSKALYGALKLEDERAFAGWGAARGKRVVTARIFNLAGPYINRRSSYALASFIADVLAGRPVAVRADRPVYRSSYTAIEELDQCGPRRADGDAPRERSVSFDTAGQEALEMGELAERVDIAPGHGFAALEARPPMRAGAAADRYVGDGAAYAALGRELGVAAVPLDDQIRQTAEFISQYPEAP